MKLFSGTSNKSLAQKLARELNIKLGKIGIKKFSDNETYVNVRENVKGEDCFVLQSGSNPANENLMELLIIIDALKRLKPKKITVILPFYPYRRQERKVESGEAITSELCAKLLKAAGSDKLIVLDLHTEKVKKFFKIPFEHLTVFDLFVDYFKKKKLKNTIVVAPDEGASGINSKLAKKLGIKSCYIKKSRERKHDKVARMELTGEVKDKDVIIIDDEINTGGTLMKAATTLKKKGAKKVFFACTHGILSGNATSKLQKSKIDEIMITDSIYLPKDNIFGKIKVLSVARLLSKEIK
ncbi:MAG: ribose-phosphate pyrophosphokinase [Parcubacteria group bacterium]|nr:ribose-phosphate pyrophosphokinase [Parcubacteria group bacterium]